MIGGIFLNWFVDSMLFSMMIRTSFNEPVKTVQDLVDREMSLGDIVEFINQKTTIIKLILVLWAYYGYRIDDMKASDHELYRILGMNE